MHAFVCVLCVCMCVCLVYVCGDICVYIYISYFCPDGVSPLSASEELTQQYQSLVQVQQLLIRGFFFGFFLGGGGGGGGLRT